jgi:proteic killer suppression protein
MIDSFKSKALKLYYEKGDTSKLQPALVQKIKRMLSRLDAADTPETMDVSGYGFHQLTGNLQGFYAVKVNKNYRIIFRFEGKNAVDVDFLDYH